MTSVRTMFTPGDIARLLGVNPKTVSRWCREDKLASFRTPGGHRRIPITAVLALLGEMGIDEKAARKLLA